MVVDGIVEWFSTGTIVDPRKSLELNKEEAHGVPIRCCVGLDLIWKVEMDWQGQKLSEQLMQIILLTFAVVAFVTGFVTGSFQMMILIYAGGVVLTTLITVPNWPFFNRHPLNWLDSSEAEKHPKPQKGVSAKKKSAKK
ncbi:Microsomal signal peptidase 12 kDa subunit (SPC12) [Tripterygium wilfordii]|uniref:Signal peptidase complex subunit 1 n=2 Tax=Tripterygium wilfordii TaxID=458696 RepID=A0A7J7D4G0_TRIWF|nr:Microsomal signal peptidase 12 kDa subunit (SPC12) [Tripterygium wilfordii]